MIFFIPSNDAKYNKKKLEVYTCMKKIYKIKEI